MAEVLKTELVDFHKLNEASNGSRCGELARHVATLFAFTSDRCSDEQVDIYDGVLLRLVGMVELEVRQFVAQKMAGLRRGPEETLRKLADDEIDVAEPILRQSTVLRDADLVQIAASNSDGHRLAIAKREVLSQEVTDVLIRRGDLKVKRQVAGNSGASFSDAAMLRLIGDAASDATMQMSLSERGDLAEHHIRQLVKIAGREVRRVLLGGREIKEASLVAKAEEIVTLRMTNEYWLARYDFETARNRILTLAKQGLITEAALRRFASEERFAEAVAAFAWIVRCGVEEVSHWMVRPDPEPFLIVAKANEVSPVTVCTLLSIGPWRHRLTPEARTHAMRVFDKMTVLEAKRHIAHWNQVVLH